jgi:predicted amidophosphoribosyltransferase
MEARMSMTDQQQQTWQEWSQYPPPRIATCEFSGYEEATFCFHCGSTLLGDKTCPRCATRWVRVYTSQCPKANLKNDGGTWVHLHAPYHARGHLPGMVAQAKGVGDCEFCGDLHLYTWDEEGWLRLASSEGKTILLYHADIHPAS